MAGVKHPHVGGFVPRPGAGRPAFAQIQVAQHAAEGQNAVVMVKVILGHAVAIRDGAVVRVMEQQTVAAEDGAMNAKPLYQRVVVPFVNQHEIGPVERLVEIEEIRVVLLGNTGTGQFRVGGAKAFQRCVAMLGPQVQVRGFSARISYPDQPNQETHWHFHQRLIPDPLPPFFSRPQTIDCLLYLDETNDANGPLCVLPGSHHWTETDLPEEDYGDRPGQVTLRLPPGSLVFTHGSLWHRALPTRPEGTVRRLLLFGYGPCWMKAAIYGVKPDDGLTAQLLRGPNVDEETRELLGAAGYM